MPRGDGTGPGGMGPMTGRRLGFCAGYDSPGYTKGVPRGGGGFGAGRGRGFGRGFRGGYGRGFGQGFGYYPAAPAYYGEPVNQTAPTREQELEGLKVQAANYEQGLQDIARRISELEAESK